MTTDPATPASPASASTAASLEVRARALRTLEEHRLRMRRSAELVARSRALCARAVAPAVSSLSHAPPQLRLVKGAEASRRVGTACMRFGCGRPAAYVPRVVMGFGQRRLSIRGLPLRVCELHADDLEELSQSPEFLAELRARVAVRGGEPPGTIRVDFEPLH